MRIWVAFPSTDPARAEETAGRWAALGYKTLVMFNAEQYRLINADLVFRIAVYEGYFRAQNFACQKLVRDHGADIVVCGSDRIAPIEGRAASQLGATFWAKFPNGLGVMQPVGGAPPGDCPSPWVGRNFILRTYGGAGPFHERYFQYFGGRELFAVARSMDRLWLREDVAQPRVTQTEQDFFQKHNRGAYYARDAAIFAERSTVTVPPFEGAEGGRIVVATSSMLPELGK